MSHTKEFIPPSLFSPEWQCSVHIAWDTQQTNNSKHLLSDQTERGNFVTKTNSTKTCQLDTVIRLSFVNHFVDYIHAVNVTQQQIKWFLWFVNHQAEECHVKGDQEKPYKAVLFIYNQLSQTGLWLRGTAVQRECRGTAGVVKELKGIHSINPALVCPQEPQLMAQRRVQNVREF